MFLLDLTNKKVQFLWEVVTFLEFLSEKSSPDEVYFYLNCRNLLFRGPELNKCESTFEAIHYVRIEDAEKTIDAALEKYDVLNILTLKKQLKEKIKTKNNKSLIDSSFVLRVLLEFYKVERRNRLKLLRQAFQPFLIHKKAKQTNILFKDFRKVLNLNFTFLSELEIAELYREAFNCG
jgi:hypothetical protein